MTAAKHMYVTIIFFPTVSNMSNANCHTYEDVISPKPRVNIPSSNDYEMLPCESTTNSHVYSEVHCEDVTSSVKNTTCNPAYAPSGASNGNVGGSSTIPESTIAAEVFVDMNVAYATTMSKNE